MLNPDFLDRLPDELVEKMNTLAEDITADMARRIAKEGFLTETASWQYEKMRELYGSQVYEYVMERLQSWLGKTQGELRGLFQEAGIQAMKYDDRIYRAAGFTPKALEESPALAALLEAGLKQTSGTFHNLVGTTALGTQRVFFRVCDRAHLQVISGGMDFQRAVREAVEEAAGLCPMVEYPSGKKDSLDVAVRRCVVTGVNQTCLKIQEAQLEGLGCDLVETTAHGGARPSHAVWQGKVCSFSGKDKRYPDFRSFTGYGRGDGLGGWNCRHSFFPFFDGISESAYPRRELEAMNNATVCYKGKEIPLYEATQRQREMERNIRRFKRRAVGLKAIGQDDSPPLAYVGRWQEQLRGFLQETGLGRDYSREWIKGMSKSQSARTASAWKHLKNDGGGGIINDSRIRVPTGLVDITNTTIQAVGQPNSKILSKKQRKQLQKLNRELLRFVKDEPLGTEAAFTVDLKTMSVIHRVKGDGSDLRVCPPVEDVPYIMIHNHPSGGIFSPQDVKLFMKYTTLGMMVAVGNTGQVYTLEKVDKKLNKYGWGLFEKSVREQYPQMENNLTQAVSYMEKLMKGAKKYGFYFQTAGGKTPAKTATDRPN